MTAKEYLKQYEEAERIVQRLKTEYIQESEQVDSIRSALGGDGTPRGSGISKVTENRAIKLAEKAQALKDAEADALEIRQEIFKTINSISGEEGAVLYEKYINLHSWDGVADAVGFSKRHVQRIHEKALDLVKDVIECHSH